MRASLEIHSDWAIHTLHEVLYSLSVGTVEFSCATLYTIALSVFSYFLSLSCNDTEPKCFANHEHLSMKNIVSYPFLQQLPECLLANNLSRFTVTSVALSSSPTASSFSDPRHNKPTYNGKPIKAPPCPSNELNPLCRSFPEHWSNQGL